MHGIFYPKIRNKYEFDDVLQVAYLGLVKAAKAFDENKNNKFSTYAIATIRGVLINFVSRDKKYNSSRGTPHNLVMASYEAERENGSLESRIGTDNFEDRLIIRSDLNKAIKEFSVKEKQVLKLYFINDLYQSEIAEIINTSQNQVSRIKKRIVKKLKDSLEFNVCEKVIM